MEMAKYSIDTGDRFGLQGNAQFTDNEPFFESVGRGFESLRARQ